MFGPVGVGITVGHNQMVKNVELVSKSVSEQGLTEHKISESDHVLLPMTLVNLSNVQVDPVAASQHLVQAPNKWAVTDGWTGASGHHVRYHAAQLELKNEPEDAVHVLTQTRTACVLNLRKHCTALPTPTHDFVRWMVNPNQQIAFLANVYQDQMGEETMIRSNISFCVGGRLTRLGHRQTRKPIGKEDALTILLTVLVSKFKSMAQNKHSSNA